MKKYNPEKMVPKEAVGEHLGYKQGKRVLKPLTAEQRRCVKKKHNRFCRQQGKYHICIGLQLMDQLRSAG